MSTAGEDGQEGFSQQDVLCSAAALQSLAQSDPHRAAGLIQGTLDALAGLSSLLLLMLSDDAHGRLSHARGADPAADLPDKVKHRHFRLCSWALVALKHQA